MGINIIAAMTKDRVIGKGNSLPWHIKEDLQNFRDVTRDSVVIMGKNTWLSIPEKYRPLQDRINIVISRSLPEATGAIVCDSIEGAILKARGFGKEIFFIGGSAVYKAALEFADSLYISWIKEDYDGDVFFPEFSLSEWEEMSVKDFTGFKFIRYARKKQEERRSEMLSGKDPEVFSLIVRETERQKSELNMIPSENYCSKEVLEAMGSILNNKYAEGYPKKRYYQGNRVIDEVEELAIERAKRLFGAEYANVQPLSGSDANMSVYFALLNPCDKILGMELSQGGHLTHGSPVNFSGRMYNFISYGVEKETEMLDMDKVREIALRERPKMIVCGYTAYPRKVDFRRFSEIAREIDAILMADVSHIAGLIAGGAHESPVPYCDVVTLTTHKTLRGPRSAIILCKEKYGKAIDKAVFPGLHGGPHEHTIAAKAVAFKEAMTPEFSDYSKRIVKNAKALSEFLMSHGVKLVSDGTDNHLLLIDLIRTPFVGKIGAGKEYAVLLEEAGIITNANTVPYDPSTPFKPSGIRLGTPILTTRGFGEKEMYLVGRWIVDVLKNPEDASMRERIRSEVKSLCDRFPFY